jgi:hypothetical protein
MALKNYTTTVSVDSTVSQIEAYLHAHHNRKNERLQMKLVALVATIVTLSSACQHYTLSPPMIYGQQSDTTIAIVDKQLFRPVRTVEYKIQMVVCLDSVIAARKDSAQGKAKVGK